MSTLIFNGGTKTSTAAVAAVRDMNCKLATEAGGVVGTGVTTSSTGRTTTTMIALQIDVCYKHDRLSKAARLCRGEKCGGPLFFHILADLSRSDMRHHSVIALNDAFRKLGCEAKHIRCLQVALAKIVEPWCQSDELAGTLLMGIQRIWEEGYQAGLADRQMTFAELPVACSSAFA